MSLTNEERIRDIRIKKERRAKQIRNWEDENREERLVYHRNYNKTRKNNREEEEED